MPAPLGDDDAVDPIEARLRQNIRATIEALFEEEPEAAIGRCRHGRGAGRQGDRHGHRTRQIVGTFGAGTVTVPRARIKQADGGTTDWRSQALPRSQRLTKTAEALITAVCLSGTNTRRVKRALVALVKGAVGKDVVSRAWRKIRVDWDAWCARSLADEDIVRARRRQRGSDRWRHRWHGRMDGSRGARARYGSGGWSVAAMYTASDLQHGGCAP